MRGIHRGAISGFETITCLEDVGKNFSQCHGIDPVVSSMLCEVGSQIVQNFVLNIFISFRQFSRQLSDRGLAALAEIILEIQPDLSYVLRYPIEVFPAEGPMGRHNDNLILLLST